MYINQMYKYKKDGIVYVSGNVPESAEILETMNILNAEDGYNLIRIEDEENVGPNIWLRNSDTKESYREEIREEVNDNDN